jgi:NitT/TauT family transport system substrate-binding protein
MTFRRIFTSVVVCTTALGLASCEPKSTEPAPGAGSDPITATSDAPAFSLAWSEYPSWSVFGVAHEKKLIHKDEGMQGPIEREWGVDIVLRELDYDTCITSYGNASCDAVCITNMDSLNPAASRPSVAILPTSTSKGADACVVVGIDDVEALRNHEVYGLEKSVSEYCFVRNLEILGEKESDHKFRNRDPAVAAQQMQQGQVKAIVVWNPFVLETLKRRQDAKVLFDSTSIPGEIVDMVVMARDSLQKEGGASFAKAVIDTYYQVNEMIADPATSDDTLVAIGAKFSSLGLEEMKKVVEQTEFYDTPEKGIALFDSPEFRDTMKTVQDFCASHQIVERPTTIGYRSPAAGAQLAFDPSFIEAVKNR